MVVAYSPPKTVCGYGMGIASPLALTYLISVYVKDHRSLLKDPEKRLIYQTA